MFESTVSPNFLILLHATALTALDVSGYLQQSLEEFLLSQKYKAVTAQEGGKGGFGVNMDADLSSVWRDDTDSRPRRKCRVG